MFGRPRRNIVKQSYLLDEAARKTLGARLRSLRESAHLTQIELAAKLGLNNESIGHIERGTRAIGLPLLLAYLDAVGAKRPKLLEGLKAELAKGKSED